VFSTSVSKSLLQLLVVHRLRIDAIERLLNVSDSYPCHKTIRLLQVAPKPMTVGTAEQQTVIVVKMVHFTRYVAFNFAI
jgi:hypothetical protein